MCINEKTRDNITISATAQSMFGLGQEIRIVFLQQLESSQRNPGKFSVILFQMSISQQNAPSLSSGPNKHINCTSSLPSFPVYAIVQALNVNA